MQNIQNHNDEMDLHLEKHGVHRVETRQNELTIQCEKGILWITQTGDLRDHILYPGDRFTSRKRGRLLIEAMRESAAHIATSVQTHSNRRMTLPQSRAA